MIRPSTLDGTKDVLKQYGDEYCIIYDSGYWLAKIDEVKGCIAHNERNDEWVEWRKRMGKKKSWAWMLPMSPATIVNIPESIMFCLVDEGFVVKNISDKEWRVQVALGTAPAYTYYLISGEAA